MHIPCVPCLRASPCSCNRHWRNFYSNCSLLFSRTHLSAKCYCRLGVMQRRRLEIESHQIFADDDRAVIVATHLGYERRLVKARRHEMVEDETADLSRSGDLPNLARQRVVGGDVAQPRLRPQTSLRLHHAVNEAFMDQHIGAPRRLDERRASSRVAAEDQAPPGGLEDETEGVANRQVIDGDRRHREIAGAENLASTNFGNLDGERRYRRPELVRDALLEL